MWVVHSEALEGCLANDYCIHFKSSVDCVEALQEQVSFRGLTGQIIKFGFELSIFCFNPPPATNLLRCLLDCEELKTRLRGHHNYKGGETTK